MREATIQEEAEVEAEEDTNEAEEDKAKECYSFASVRVDNVFVCYPYLASSSF